VPGGGCQEMPGGKAGGSLHVPHPLNFTKDLRHLVEGLAKCYQGLVVCGGRLILVDLKHRETVQTQGVGKLGGSVGKISQTRTKTPAKREEQNLACECGKVTQKLVPEYSSFPRE